MQAAPCANRSVQLGRIDALLQLVPGALDSGLERFPALLTGRLQLLELPARLLLLLLRLRRGELLLILHPPLGGGLLGLRLHLLQLRAPLRDLRLHLGDVGVPHLLHPHPANPPLPGKCASRGAPESTRTGRSGERPGAREGRETSRTPPRRSTPAVLPQR